MHRSQLQRTMICLFFSEYIRTYTHPVLPSLNHSLVRCAATKPQGTASPRCTKWPCTVTLLPGFDRARVYFCVGYFPNRSHTPSYNLHLHILASTVYLYTRRLPISTKATKAEPQNPSYPCGPENPDRSPHRHILMVSSRYTEHLTSIIAAPAPRTAFLVRVNLFNTCIPLFIHPSSCSPHDELPSVHENSRIHSTS